MYKGSLKTETFNPERPTINMIDWVEPTLYNTGKMTVFLNGIAINPGDSFILGPAGVEMNGNLSLVFPEVASEKCEVKVNYVLINTCSLTPR